MEQYLEQIKDIVDQLALASSPADIEDIILETLNGLPTEIKIWLLLDLIIWAFPLTIVAEEVIEVIVVVDTLILEEIIEVSLEEDKVIRASQSGTHSLLVQLLVRFAISQITLLLSVGIGWITTSNHWFSNQLQVLLPGLMSLLHLLHRTGISIQQPQIT
ncbi:hypothetical protein Vadar_028239 [Vaccinium darrowii]|uniref:Uncharacterized protein n=1 Tax=Vaccinium darrowii TaxID=229202 RepID=A0ACB7YGM0_9ERIC|nr:hypothetical protein Vadar_028239 [Vaccinium darrowii]